MHAFMLDLEEKTLWTTIAILAFAFVALAWLLCAANLRMTLDLARERQLRMAANRLAMTMTTKADELELKLAACERALERPWTRSHQETLAGLAGMPPRRMAEEIRRVNTFKPCLPTDPSTNQPKP